MIGDAGGREFCVCQLGILVVRTNQQVVLRGNINVPIAVDMVASTCMKVEAREVVRLAVTTLT